WGSSYPVEPGRAAQTAAPCRRSSSRTSPAGTSRTALPSPAGRAAATPAARAGGHRDRHHPVGRVRLVRARDAPARHRQAIHALRQETPERDVVPVAGRQTHQERALALRIVDIDRIGPPRDRVLELLPAEDVLRGEGVVSGDPPRLAHPDGDSALGDVRALEAGHVLARERGYLPHLPPPLPLGASEIPHARAQDAGDARAVHRQLALVRRSEEQDVLAGETQLTGRARLPDQIPQPM